MSEAGIVLNPASTAPIYQQISAQIIAMIERNELLPGEVLWPERQLSEHLGVARGTIRKAYDECKKRNLVQSKQGGGYQIISAGEKPVSKEQLAAKAALTYFSDMEVLGYDRTAALEFLNLGTGLSALNSPLHIGTIECRKSMFNVYESVLDSLDRVSVTHFLTSDLQQFPELIDEVRKCDLLLVTAAHYFDLYNQFPDLESKLLEVTFNWSDSTVEEIKALAPTDRVGIVYSNIRAVLVIKSALRLFSCIGDVDICSTNNPANLDGFLSSKDVVIMEPPYDEWEGIRARESWRAFFQRGGKQCFFQHVMDPNSIRLIHHNLSILLDKRK